MSSPVGEQLFHSVVLNNLSEGSIIRPFCGMTVLIQEGGSNTCQATERSNKDNVYDVVT